MTEFLKKIHSIPSFATAIISGISLFRDSHAVRIDLVTEKAFSPEEESKALAIARTFVPEEFDCSLNIAKLTPDEKMVARAVRQAAERYSKAMACLLNDEDVVVTRTADGFDFTISVIADTAMSEEVVEKIISALGRMYCGRFTGRCVRSGRKIDSIEIEEEKENIEYDIPVRTFEISDFSFIEGSEVQKTAVYLADVAYQKYVLEHCGIPVSGLYLVCLDGDYVFEPAPLVKQHGDEQGSPYDAEQQAF